MNIPIRTRPPAPVISTTLVGQLNAIPPAAVSPGRSVTEGDGVTPVTSKGRTIDQISHRLMRNALRGFLLQAMRARPGAVEGISSIGCQASAALYTLLLDHPIDRRGRCPSCRGFGAVIGLRRCRIHRTAIFWLLLQPDEATLRSRLASELGLGTTPPPGAGRPSARSLLTIRARIDPRDIDVPPRIEAEPRGPTTTRHQAPTVPLPRSLAGRRSSADPRLQLPAAGQPPTPEEIPTMTMSSATGLHPLLDTPDSR